MSREARLADHEQLRELCAAYSLGALDPPESARIEEHLREGCDSCRSEIEVHRRTVEALGTLLEEKSPPESAGERLFARLAAQDRGHQIQTAGRPALRPAPVASGRLGWLMAAAALLIAVPALWLAVDSSRTAARLEQELAAFETTTDPIVPIYDLVPTGAAAGARARATFDPRSGDWRVFAHDLLPPPEGMTYQGWLLTVEGPLGFGTFLPDETAHAFLVMRLTEEPYDGRVLITLEPEGGSDRPSGSPVFEHPEAAAPLE